MGFISHVWHSGAVVYCQLFKIRNYRKWGTYRPSIRANLKCDVLVFLNIHRKTLCVQKSQHNIAVDQCVVRTGICRANTMEFFSFLFSQSMFGKNLMCVLHIPAKHGKKFIYPCPNGSFRRISKLTIGFSVLKSTYQQA